MGKRPIAVAGIILSMLLGGCGGGEKPTEEPLPSEPVSSPQAVEFALPYYKGASLHPILGENRTNLNLVGLVYEGLFSLDNTFTPYEVLVRNWTVDESGLVYTFELKDTRFSDGSALTAAEAAASLELARNSTLYKNRLSDVEGIRAEGNTLTLTLSRPNTGLPALLDIPIIKEQEGQHPLGTGRYSLAQEGEEFFLKRQGAPGEGVPDAIPLRAVQDADGLIHAFDTREVGLVTTDLTGSDTLGFSSGYEVWEYPTTDLLYLGFQTGEGFCADAALRQAIGCMVDRASVVTALYARHAQEAALPVHPANSGYDRTAADALTYSPQKAAELLTRAGYTRREERLYYRGRQVKLELLVNADNAFRTATADFLAEELEKLGIAVTVSKLSWSEFTARLTAGTFDIYLAEVLMTADFDPESLVGSAGSLNFGKWNDPETDALLSALRSGESGARRQFYDLLGRQSPIVPICFKNHTALTQWGRVEGLTPTRADPFAGESWRLAAE